jgi:hypothetical protein
MADGTLLSVGRSLTKLLTVRRIEHCWIRLAVGLRCHNNAGCRREYQSRLQFFGNHEGNGGITNGWRSTTDGVCRGPESSLINDVVAVSGHPPGIRPRIVHSFRSGEY